MARYRRRTRRRGTFGRSRPKRRSRTRRIRKIRVSRGGIRL